MLAPIFIALFSLTAPAKLAQDAEPDCARYVGTWRGSLAAGSRPLAFLFHLRPDGKGGLTGSLDSPDEKLFGLPIDAATLDGAKGLDLSLKAVSAHYVATLEEDGAVLAGAWKQRGAVVPLRCERGPLVVFEAVAGQEQLFGSWEGKLLVQGQSVRLLFHLRDDGGRVSGTLDSPDQGTLGLPLSSATLTSEGQVSLTIGLAGASFEGALEEGGKLVGSWKQGGSSFPLEFQRAAQELVRRRPQLPMPPFPYRAEEVRFTGQAGIELAGTLTLPGDAAQEGPFPAALLITGSGSQDRDETIFEHRPFLVLADALTRRGIAVLRVDDRGVGSSGGSLDTATTLDLALDAEAGFDWLRQRTEIDSARVGLIGHSEGGLIAPLVATRRPEVAFAVLLAGPGLRGDEILIRQGELLARAAGSSEETIAANRRLQEQLFPLVLDATLSWGQLEQRVRAAVAAEPEIAKLVPADQVGSLLESVRSPWMRTFLALDPRPALEQMHCPVLALVGEKDLQVPAAPNETALRAAFASGPHPDATVRVLPGLNHLFQPCTSGALSEYADIETTFDPGTLTAIGDWIVARMGSSR